MDNPGINLIVALPSEARPLNQLLGLKRQQPDGLLPVYRRGDISLVISGPGASAAHRGVEYLQAERPCSAPAWFNIGIAGHLCHPLGTAVLASEVRAAEKNQSWRLTPPRHLNAQIGPVQTCAEPVSEYPGDCSYDMEAASFVASAQRYAPLERIQVLKIISDNRENPTAAINAKMVRNLIRKQAVLINQLLREMIEPA